MSIILNGREEAEKILISVRESLAKLPVKPKMVSIVVGDVGKGLFYQRLKEKTAKKVGASLDIQEFDQDAKRQDILRFIQKANKDKSIHGLMIQLPLPDSLSTDERDVLINAIHPTKDVDGMRKDSPFFAPVIKAVIECVYIGIQEVVKSHSPKDISMIIVGAKGFVGGKLMDLNLDKLFQFPDLELTVDGADIDTKDLAQKIKNADILISATGRPGLIKADMVKKGAILIDVGAPKPDIDKSAYEKAAFVTPVPGGVGPMTIAFLMQNLLLATSTAKIAAG